MATTDVDITSNHKRSTSHNRGGSPPLRPTTPLRPPSRNSLRSSIQTPTNPNSYETRNPLTTLEPAFGELSDSMADLEANFVHLQLLHESLSRFNECFASFLYGLNVNAFCVDFPEAPIPESFKRTRENPRFSQVAVLFDEPGKGASGKSISSDIGQEADQTFLTTDTSFVENPPASSVKMPSTRDTSRFSTPGKRVVPASGTKGGRVGTSNSSAAGRGADNAGVARGSRLARATGRGRGIILGR